MPSLNAQLKNIVIGNSVSLRRTIDRSASGFEAGVTISKAWFTVKSSTSHADPGIVQKIITTTDTPDVGQIENDGAGDVNPVVRFDLTEANTLIVGTRRRVYDIKVETNAGLFYTPEIGETLFSDRVTIATI